MMTAILVVIIVMLLIWQINIIIVLSFLIFFLGLVLVFFSSVLWSVGDGSWIILVFAVIMFLIMSIWNYGSKLKYETEVKQKLSMDLMRQLGSNLGTMRAPGIGTGYYMWCIKVSIGVGSKNIFSGNYCWHQTVLKLFILF